MNRSEALQNPVLGIMVDKLASALGDRLRSVVLYGSAARGEFHRATSDLNLIVVLADMGARTLEALTPAVGWWRKKGQPPPRLFSSETLARETDVFPIEFLDIRDSHLVLRGEDPFSGIEVGTEFLRLECERELREKLMRLREGYVECHASRSALALLLTDSYTTFVALFRGCLHLVGASVPARNLEVVAAFCARAGLAGAPFEEVDRLKRGEEPPGDLKALFSRYHEQLTKVVGLVDRFHPGRGGEAR
jgi:predicted nucleotidyltransferase